MGWAHASQQTWKPLVEGAASASCQRTHEPQQRPRGTGARCSAFPRKVVGRTVLRGFLGAGLRTRTAEQRAALAGPPPPPPATSDVLRLRLKRSQRAPSERKPNNCGYGTSKQTSEAKKREKTRRQPQCQRSRRVAAAWMPPAPRRGGAQHQTAAPHSSPAAAAGSEHTTGRRGRGERVTDQQQRKLTAQVRAGTSLPHAAPQRGAAWTCTALAPSPGLCAPACPAPSGTAAAASSPLGAAAPPVTFARIPFTCAERASEHSAASAYRLSCPARRPHPPQAARATRNRLPPSHAPRPR